MRKIFLLGINLRFPSRFQLWVCHMKLIIFIKWLLIVISSQFIILFALLNYYVISELCFQNTLYIQLVVITDETSSSD